MAKVVKAKSRNMDRIRQRREVSLEENRRGAQDRQGQKDNPGPRTVVLQASVGTVIEAHSNPAQEEQTAEWDPNALHTPEEIAEHNKNTEKNNKDALTSSIGKSTDDFTEDEDPEKDKFKIQEGDIIDFMFKEIVLASANYVGDYVTRHAGYLTYKMGSNIYHAAWPWVKDGFTGAGEAISDGWTKMNTKTDEKTILEGDDNTTIFAKTIYAKRDAAAQSDNVIKNQNEIWDIVVAAKNGTASELISQSQYDKMTDEQKAAVKTIVPDSMKKMLEQVKPEDLAKIPSEFFVDRMAAAYEKQKNEDVFAANYAAAVMLREKAKDPNFNSIEAFDRIVKDGKRAYYMALLNENPAYTPQQLIENSNEFYAHEKEAIKAGKYKELQKDEFDDKAGNEKLDELTKMFSQSPHNQKSFEALRQMQLQKEFNDMEKMMKAKDEENQDDNNGFGKKVEKLHKEQKKSVENIDLGVIKAVIKDESRDLGRETPDSFHSTAEFYQKMVDENARLEAEGKKPKFSDKNMKKFLQEATLINKQLEKFAVDFASAQMLNKQDIASGETFDQNKYNQQCVLGREIFLKGLNKGEDPTDMLKMAENAYQHEAEQLGKRYKHPEKYSAKSNSQLLELEALPDKEPKDQPEGMRVAAKQPSTSAYKYEQTLLDMQATEADRVRNEEKKKKKKEQKKEDKETRDEMRTQLLGGIGGANR